MKTKLRFSVLSSAILALVACGGGGGDGTTASPTLPDNPATPTTPTTPAVPTTTSVAVTVVDGAVQNALVCLDANRNGACDAGETQARTDAGGKAVLDVPNGDVGLYRIVAAVGTDAVDADRGPVTVAYSLRAPADQTAVVSPFTTLVERVVDETGATSAQVETNLRTQLGLADSLFGNYTTAGDKSAATIASALAQTSQLLFTGLAASVGQPDSTAAAMTTADIATEISNMLTERLPTFKQRAGSASVKAACAGGVGAADCKTATAAIAAYFAATPVENRLTASNIGVAVGVRKQIAAAASSSNTVGSGQFSWLRYADPLNWRMEGSVANTAEATPVNGVVKYRDFVKVSTNGTVLSIGTGGADVDGALHWSGSTWTNCPGGYQSSNTVRDEIGRSMDVDYCNGSSVGLSRRATVSIAGKTLAEVVNMVKAYPYTTRGPYGSSYADWGPVGSVSEIAATYGGSTFPEGSSIYYQRSIGISSAPAYAATDANLVLLSPADVAAGGDARLNPALACNVASVQTAAASLDDLIARSPGKPCVLNPGTITGAGGAVLSSGLTNETWGGTVFSLGAVGPAPSATPVATGTSSTATSYYTANTRIRVSFAGAGSNAVTFYECKERDVNVSTRNCVAAGTGTYTITTLGDARVLSFSDIPGMAAYQGSQTVAVERGGKVYYGSVGKLVARNQIRLNLAAGNALTAAYTGQGAVAMTPITP